MIHDRCDYCRREFGYEEGTPAICVNCGLENVRRVEGAAAQRPEVAMVGGGERAVKAAGRPRRRRKK